MKPYGPAPSANRHARAVAALRTLAERAPVDLARWLLGTRPGRRAKLEVLEARHLSVAPVRPMYAVPKPAEGPSPKATLGAILGEAFLESVKAESPDVQVVRVDFEELKRQSLLKGGHELSLFVRAKGARAKADQEFMLGIPLPPGDADGGETPERMMSKMGWYLQMMEALGAVLPSGKRPALDLLATYLWPGTGLRDPQEHCNVYRGERPLPGFLRGFEVVKRADGSRRRANAGRLRHHQRCDRERRKAAAWRAEHLGAAGLTEAELAALVPDIDLDEDDISMMLVYPVLRLWERPHDRLLAELPPTCAGLSLFGWRPAATTARDVLRQCGWALRKLPAAERAEAASLLGTLAEVHLEPEAVRDTLAALKLA